MKSDKVEIDLSEAQALLARYEVDRGSAAVGVEEFEELQKALVAALVPLFTRLVERKLICLDISTTDRRGTYIDTYWVEKVAGKFESMTAAYQIVLRADDENLIKGD